MTFLITDIPRLLPELLLLALAVLVLGSDVLERWSSDPQVQHERSRAAALLTLYGLGFALLVALVQSKYLFAIAEPTPGSNGLLAGLIGLGRNLQAGGPGGEPILGAFSTDNLTMVARLTFIGAAFLTTLLTFDDAPSANPGEFYALLLFATVGMNAMAAASELIIAYVALELSSIALYVLAGYSRNDPRSSEAGLKYYLFGALSSGILLYGMSLAYGFTASISRADSGPPAVHTLFSEIAKASAASSGDTRLLTLAMVFVIAGIGYKVAVVPFHSWSPDVYQGAPTPITAFISTASKTAGFILLYRVLAAAFPALAGTPSLASFGGWTSLLAIIALATVLVGNLSALPQTNAKRLLAYSSISHAGFVLLALLFWRTSSTSNQNFSAAAFLYYLISYTATNLGAFGALSVVRQALGGDDISDLNGLSRRNLRLTVMLTVLVLSLAGIPPLAGFWAKFFVFMAAYGAGALWLVVVMVLMTVVSLYYYLGLLKAMWMREPATTDPLLLPRAANGTVMIATALVVLLGVLPNLVWGVLNSAALVAGR